MNRFVRYWNQNRKGIITSIIFIAFILCLISILNNMWKEKSKEQYVNDVTGKPIKSVITGENITEKTTEKNTEVIESFILYCNNKEYNNAYELLTDICKEEYKCDVNNFIQQYVAKIFDSKKTYKIELWLRDGDEYTYKVTLYDDNILATGGSNINKNHEDYITVTNSKECKISVNGLVKKENINKSIENDEFNITINSKKVYKNYEIFNLTFKNKTEKTIMLNKYEYDEGICLVDSNNTEYISLTSEISQGDLLIDLLSEKEIEIKFNKIYSPYGKKIKKIKFKNIIVDYEEDAQKREIEISI